MIILDLEMTCCEGDEFPKSEMEIIEIGAVRLRFEGEILDTFRCFVRPVIHEELTDFCKSLLGISQKQVASAESFGNACEKFFRWVWSKGDISFCSWGRGDLAWLNNECKRHDVVHPFTRHGNLFKAFGSGQRRLLKRHGMKWIGRRHRALNDALTYAHLVMELQPEITYREIQ